MASLIKIVDENENDQSISNDLLCSDCIEPPAYVPPNLREIFPMDVLDRESISSDSKFIVVIGNSGIGNSINSNFLLSFIFF